MREDQRARLIAEIRAAQSHLDPFSVEREAVDAMPGNFIYRYELLWLKAFGRSVGARKGGVDPNPVHRANRRVRTSTGQTETRGGARTRGGVAGADDRDVIENHAALRMKQRVDRKLRSLARDIAVWMHDDDARAGVRRCSKPTCRRFAEDTWTHCPWDGYPTEEMN